MTNRWIEIFSLVILITGSKTFGTEKITTTSIDHIQSRLFDRVNETLPNDEKIVDGEPADSKINSTITNEIISPNGQNKFPNFSEKIIRTSPVEFRRLYSDEIGRSGKSVRDDNSSLGLFSPIDGATKIGVVDKTVESGNWIDDKISPITNFDDKFLPEATNDDVTVDKNNPTTSTMKINVANEEMPILRIMKDENDENVKTDDIVSDIKSVMDKLNRNPDERLKPLARNMRRLLRMGFGEDYSDENDSEEETNRDSNNRCCCCFGNPSMRVKTRRQEIKRPMKDWKSIETDFGSFSGTNMRRMIPRSDKLVLVHSSRRRMTDGDQPNVVTTTTMPTTTMPTTMTMPTTTTTTTTTTMPTTTFETEKSAVDEKRKQIKKRPLVNRRNMFGSKGVVKKCNRRKNRKKEITEIKPRDRNAVESNYRMIFDNNEDVNTSIGNARNDDNFGEAITQLTAR